MVPLLKTLCLIVLFAALGYGGFIAGQQLKNFSVPKISPYDFVPQAKSIQPADKPYAVTPDVGPLSRTIILEKIDITDGVISTILPAAEATDISAGQDVVFYAAPDNRLMPVVGLVASVATENDRTHIFINASLPPDVAPKWARVVVMETTTKRLPITALFEDTEGNAYVWKASENPEGAFTILHQSLSVGVKGDDYFEAGPQIAMDDRIVANPPATLESGQTIALMIRGMNAPVHGYREQAIIHQKEEGAAAHRLEVAAFQAATTPGGIRGCPANISPEGLPAEILAITGLPTAPVTPPPAIIPFDAGAADTTPAPTPSCGACGSSNSYSGPPPATPDGPSPTQ